MVENLSLFALIYLVPAHHPQQGSWESFIIRLDILTTWGHARAVWLRIFHYSPWYTYFLTRCNTCRVENLSLFALIYLYLIGDTRRDGWESFIIRLDILSILELTLITMLRIFHYSPWYTYHPEGKLAIDVENLSLFALIYLSASESATNSGWESFIIRLDILISAVRCAARLLRIFHYSPWYTYFWESAVRGVVENLSLFALIYLWPDYSVHHKGWESFIIRLDILTHRPLGVMKPLRIFHYSPWYT